MQNINPIIHFNFNLADYIDEGWLNRIAYGDIIVRYRQNTSSSQHLSNYLIRHFGLSDRYAFDIPNEIKPFVFLSPRELTTLIKCTGAVLKAETIKKVILGTEIESLKADIGDDAYYYGLRRSSIFRKICVREKRAHHNAVTVGQLVVQSGANCLLTTIDSLPREIKQRLLIKIPYDWIQPSCKEGPTHTGDTLKLISAIQKDIAPPSTSTMVTVT